MAKKAAAGGIGAEFSKAISAIKRRVLSYADDFGVMRKKVAELAPDVIGLFNKIKADLPAGTFGLADFAREFDPTVPTNPRENKSGEAGYTSHKVYQALDYMNRTTRPKRTGQQGAFNGKMAKFERMIATLLTIAKDENDVWKAVSSEWGLTPRALATLKRRVSEVEPLMDLSNIVKPVNFSAAKVIPMTAPAKRTETNVSAENADVRAGMDALGQRGRRVNVRAAAGRARAQAGGRKAG